MEHRFLDFRTLRRRARLNDWLVAPRDVTPRAPDGRARRYPVPAPTLAAMWCAIIEEEPRTAIVAMSSDRLRIEATQRSAVFGFTGDISAWCLPIRSGGSTILIYSRSRAGFWDLGANRRRVARWLRRLEAWVREGAY